DGPRLRLGRASQTWVPHPPRPLLARGWEHQFQPEGRHKHGAPLSPAVGMSGIRFFPPRQFIRSILISHTFENREYVGHQACVLSQLPVKSRSLAPLVMTNDSCQWRKPPALAKRWPRLEWGTRLRWCRPSGYLPPTSSISSVCAWLQSSSARLWMLPRDS